MPDDSTRTVLVALGAGLGVALAKIGAAVFTGSSAMAAEASHSLSDTANDLFLFVAQRRSSRHPDGGHPLGYGREAYFWALIAALGVFIAGAAFSLREGIAELIHPGVTSSFTVAYVVLAISAVFDLVSFRQSAGQLIGRARRHHQDLLDEARRTSDPTLRAVFVEDAVSVSGDVITLAALALNELTGSSIPQGIAAVVIGLVLIRTSLRLGKRSHDFLVGAWLLPPATSPTPAMPPAPARSPRQDDDDFTQPLRAADEDRIRTFLLGYPGVTAIREVLVTFTGPGRVWVTARLDIDDGLTGAAVKTLVRGIESGMKRESEAVYRVDVVPVGRVSSSSRNTNDSYG
ncbi:MAG: cation diffusion facilitator family transporter [Streptosporangiaceae bacterium]